MDRHAILASLLDHVDHWAGRVLDPALMERWQGWLGTLGRRVRVYTEPLKEQSPFTWGWPSGWTRMARCTCGLDSGEVRRVIAADVGLGEA